MLQLHSDNRNRLAMATSVIWVTLTCKHCWDQIHGKPVDHIMVRFDLSKMALTHLVSLRQHRETADCIPNLYAGA
jgi:hypothetical protein